MSTPESNPSDASQPWAFDHLGNVGHTLTETARHLPDSLAVAAPKSGQPKQCRPGKKLAYDTITFNQLEANSNQVAAGVEMHGVKPGTRVALMVPPGIDFVTMVFGLFKAGATVILIDPGMGRKNMIGCLADAKPDAMLGIPKAQLARQLFRRRFRNCRHNFVVGRWPGCISTHTFKSLAAGSFQPVGRQQEDPAAIIFTTGSTGPPKGVLYRHRTFIQQAVQIRDYFQIQPGTVDVSGFPLFALFNTAMGTSTIFPQMDATRPADVYPPNIIDAVDQFSADQSFGSPALWNTVSMWCEANDAKMPGIRRVLSAGAPVPPDVLKRVRAIIAPNGDGYTPYGATEALPVACNSATVVLNETAKKTENGCGTCVGHRFPKIDWRVIEISDRPLPNIADTSEVPTGTVGELIVRGPVVTDQYVTRTDANADHKIDDDTGENPAFWHRMGDVGYLDEQERFWFCGRKAHRVQTERGTMFTIPCEGIVNAHPHVYRSALVGIPAGSSPSSNPANQTSPAADLIPVIVIQPFDQHWPDSPADYQRFRRDLLAHMSRHWQTESIQHVLFRRKLPVDIRHNSKIFREQLAPWAAEKLTR